MKNLKKLREEKGLTQIDLAKLFKVSLSTYRMWEYEAAEPSPENQKKLDEYLKGE